MDCMLDLETLGRAPGCAVRSVGAAAFDPAGDGYGETFKMNVRSWTCWLAGLTVDRETVDWWDKQSQAAKEAAKVDPRDLVDVVRSFHDWFGANKLKHLWCQGAGFDEPVWQRAAAAVGLAPPWRYWEVRCTRTIYHAADFDPRSVSRDGVHHGALDDALHQVKCVQMSYHLIRQTKRLDIDISQNMVGEPGKELS